MATIKDIAKRSGLSIGTISKYLNGGRVHEKNRIAIEDAVREYGFEVNELARGLRSNRSRTIGVVIPELSNQFITTIISAMEDILRQSGYGVLICDCRTNEKQEAEAVKFLLTKRVDGIVSMPASKTGDYLLPALERDIPIVLLDRMIEELRGRVSAVLTDTEGAACAAVNMLLDAGHTDIGIILGPRDIYTTKLRLSGYRRALIERGIMPDERNIAYSDYTVRGGSEGMLRLLAGRAVSSVMCTNSETTLGGIITITDAGLHIPDQISVIGFDNVHLAQALRPKLTIVTQPLEEIGATAAKILLANIAAGERKNEIIVLDTNLLRGQSVLNII